MGDDPDRPFVMPGDPVDKTKLGHGRLRRYWNAQFIELANWTPPNQKRINVAGCVAFLSLRSRGRYTLRFSELLPDAGAFSLGKPDEYRCHGILDLLARAASLGAKERVKRLLSVMKELGAAEVGEVDEELAAALDVEIDLATGAPCGAEGAGAPEAAQAAPCAQAGALQGRNELDVDPAAVGGEGGEAGAQDSPAEVVPGECGDALDGGGVVQESGGPTDSPASSDRIIIDDPALTSTDEEKASAREWFLETPPPAGAPFEDAAE